MTSTILFKQNYYSTAQVIINQGGTSSGKTYDFNSGYDSRTGSGDGLRVTKTFTNTKISFSTTLSPLTFEGLQITFDFAGYADSYFTLYAGAIFQVTPQNSNVQFGQMVQCERILPDMSQKDFLKDTFQRFGIICQTDVYSKTITFSSLKEIVGNIPIAKDWTSKCIDQGKTGKLSIGQLCAS